MNEFFNDEVLLSSPSAITLYNSIKDLPIIDYHCHLDQRMIKNDDSFSDIGELWLAGDHYKWRAMRMCGVDEKFITGDASFKEKFLKYCEIMPKLIGNPLYYWSHFELKQIFDIGLEINKENALTIYDLANKKLKDLTVRTLLQHFRVKVVCTTDDPIDDLLSHGTFGGIEVRPSFRPDKVYNFNDEYIEKLGKVCNKNIETLSDLKACLVERLDYFIAHGCKVTDHGFQDFPAEIASDEEAEKLYKNRKNLAKVDLNKLFGNLLVFLMKEYKKRDILVQLHFAVTRNINTPMFKQCGVDSGFDVMSREINLDAFMNFLNSMTDEERPHMIVYSLNPNTTIALANISGAFRNVIVGAAWWFNDSVEGIRNQFKIVSEYACLGTSLGMLTDSRSFSSYSRFDFFRRLLSDYIGDKIEKGEYTLASGLELVQDIAYNNVARALKLIK